jgi:hypothetical protein
MNLLRGKEKSFHTALREAITIHSLYSFVYETVIWARKEKKKTLAKEFQDLYHMAEISFVPPSEEKEYPSAFIRRSSTEYSLHFNQKFLKRYMEGYSDFAFVLLHEIAHRKLGHLTVFHTYQKERVPAHILTEELLANRLAGEYFLPSSRLLSFYPKRFLPTLLHPKNSLFPGVGEVSFPLFKERFLPLLKKEKDLKEEARKDPDPLLHLAYTLFTYLWSHPPFSLSHFYIFSLCEKVLSYFNFPELSFRPMIVVIPVGEGGEGGCLLPGKGEKPWKEKISLKELSSNQKKKVTPFLVALRKSIVEDRIGNPLLPDFFPERTVVFFPGRKEIPYLFHPSYQSVFFTHWLYKDLLKTGKVYLYLDVSLSVFKVLPVVMGVLSALKEYLGDPIYGFSNKVFPISVKELKEGRVRTTGGTDLEPVLTHALREGFPQILIITDGLVSSPSRTLINRFLKQTIPYFLFLSRFPKVKTPTGSLYLERFVEALTPLTGGKKTEGKRWWVVSL